MNFPTKLARALAPVAIVAVRTPATAADNPPISRGSKRISPASTR